MESKGDAGGGEEASLLNEWASRCKSILKKIASAPGIIIAKLQPSPSPSPPSPPPPPPSPPPPPLFPVMQNLEKNELGKLALSLGVAVTTGLLFATNSPAGEVKYYVTVGVMGACTIIWNGILFGKPCVELLGINLMLLCLFVLGGFILPLRFWWACWLAAAFSLIPSLYLLLSHLQLQ